MGKRIILKIIIFFPFFPCQAERGRGLDGVTGGIENLRKMTAESLAEAAPGQMILTDSPLSNIFRLPLFHFKDFS
jgi:hypothetical protein